MFTMLVPRCPARGSGTSQIANMPEETWILLQAYILLRPTPFSQDNLAKLMQRDIFAKYNISALSFLLRPSSTATTRSCMCYRWLGGSCKAFKKFTRACWASPGLKNHMPLPQPEQEDADNCYRIPCHLIPDPSSHISTTQVFRPPSRAQ